jgi:hypothetical protein
MPVQSITVALLFRFRIRGACSDFVSLDMCRHSLSEVFIEVEFAYVSL